MTENLFGPASIILYGQFLHLIFNSIFLRIRFFLYFFFLIMKVSTISFMSQYFTHTFLPDTTTYQPDAIYKIKHSNQSPYMTVTTCKPDARHQIIHTNQTPDTTYQPDTRYFKLTRLQILHTNQTSDTRYYKPTRHKILHTNQPPETSCQPDTRYYITTRHQILHTNQTPDIRYYIPTRHRVFKIYI